MLRPSFPTFSRESEKLDSNAILEVIVIVNNKWKVGDLVDWYTDGCYWSGILTKILGNDKVEVILFVVLFNILFGFLMSYSYSCKSRNYLVLFVKFSLFMQ